MKKNIKISVIVPIYNSQKYLKYCLNSVLKQTYHNYELILIDDGSTDNSAAICDEYANTHNNVLVIHNKNSGVSASRNHGIRVATGDYITFLDADDWLEDDALETLAKLVNESQSLICGSMKDIWPHTNIKRLFLDSIYNKDTNNDSFFEHITGTTCGMLFDLKAIKENNILFPSDMKNGEDSCFLSQYLLKINNIVTTSKIVYNYNKLEKDTAVSKYYEDTNKWRYKQAQLQIDALKIWNVNNKDIINKVILSRFEESLTNYFNGNNDKKIIETYNMFKTDLISINEKSCILSTNLKNVENLIEANNIISLKNSYIKINKSSFMNKIKETVKGVCRFFKTKKYIL